MFLFAAIFCLFKVAADSPDFCIPDTTTTPPGQFCFTNWPEVAAVCPKHPLGADPYGYLTRGTLIERLVDGYPGNCSPLQAGARTCTQKVFSPDYSKPGRPTTEYASFWTVRTINKQGHPSWYYGGMSWPQVCVFFFSLIF